MTSEDAERATAHRRVLRKRQTVAHQPLGRTPKSLRPSSRPSRAGREAASYPSKLVHRKIDPLAPSRPQTTWRTRLAKLLAAARRWISAARR
ncbi:hypothetical protein [Kribbella monticola]|uniref:hypothetical protein n=1 Tax=Kribbella monticola TaxID=2185285 RepID=UPI00130078B9|nr:hypothetical protein [Kribbella monticola]